MIVMNISIAIRSKRHNALWIGMMLMSMAQYEIREQYAMFVCFLLFPFHTRDEVKTDGSYMKFYQSQIIFEHPNLVKYAH
eukprot:scaffold392211_cov90-Attheya_sp.AAC.1